MSPPSQRLHGNSPPRPAFRQAQEVKPRSSYLHGKHFINQAFLISSSVLVDFFFLMKDLVQIPLPSVPDMCPLSLPATFQHGYRHAFSYFKLFKSSSHIWKCALWSDSSLCELVSAVPSPSAHLPFCCLSATPLGHLRLPQSVTVSICRGLCRLLGSGLAHQVVPFAPFAGSQGLGMPEICIL